MAKSYEDLVSEAKAETEQTDVESVREASRPARTSRWSTCGSPTSGRRGTSRARRRCPGGSWSYKSAMQLPDKDARIVVHCALGGRGLSGGEEPQGDGLRERGQHAGRASSAWREKGYEVEVAPWRRGYRRLLVVELGAFGFFGLFWGVFAVLLDGPEPRARPLARAAWGGALRRGGGLHPRDGDPGLDVRPAGPEGVPGPHRRRAWGSGSRASPLSGGYAALLVTLVACSTRPRGSTTSA